MSILALVFTPKNKLFQWPEKFNAMVLYVRDCSLTALKANITEKCFEKLVDMLGFYGLWNEKVCTPKWVIWGDVRF